MKIKDGIEAGIALDLVQALTYGLRPGEDMKNLLCVRINAAKCVKQILTYSCQQSHIRVNVTELFSDTNFDICKSTLPALSLHCVCVPCLIPCIKCGLPFLLLPIVATVRLKYHTPSNHQY